MTVRSKWNVKNFFYIVFETHTGTDQLLNEKLHERKSYFIKQYATINKDYNSSRKSEGNTRLKKVLERLQEGMQHAMLMATIALREETFE